MQSLLELGEARCLKVVVEEGRAKLVQMKHKTAIWMTLLTCVIAALGGDI
jgi:hypothetical protein